MYCDDGSFWKHAQSIYYFEHKNAGCSDVEYFIKWYTDSLQFDNYETERLYEQFVEFKCLSGDELPTDALKDVILSEHDNGSIEY